MNAFVITLLGNDYSEQAAERCIASGERYGIHVKQFAAITPDQVNGYLAAKGINWTWRNDNKVYDGVRHVEYKTAHMKARIACAISHLLLWELCSQNEMEMLILEHDSVFTRPLPEIEHNGICQINSPLGATKGARLLQRESVRIGPGTHPKISIGESKEIPDGLAGNSAYLLKPDAASDLLYTVAEVGLWPNDALMCIQMFPYLQYHYPFVTKVQSGLSTTSL
jgi:GR25 family glycosyltransferase involved in LPS biosynthesis